MPDHARLVKDPVTCAPSGKAQILDAEKAYEILPECTKVVLTGTSFINRTAEGLLAACKCLREVSGADYLVLRVSFLVGVIIANG